jgi:hypothetical protein
VTLPPIHDAHPAYGGSRYPPPPDPRTRGTYSASPTGGPNGYPAPPGGMYNLPPVQAPSDQRHYGVEPRDYYARGGSFPPHPQPEPYNYGGYRPPSGPPYGAYPPEYARGPGGPPQQAAPRQRTSIACRYCRKRKVSNKFLFSARKALGALRGLLTVGASRFVAVGTARLLMGSVQTAGKRETSVYFSPCPLPQLQLSSLSRRCLAAYPQEHLCSAPLGSPCRREGDHQEGLEERLSHPLVARSRRILLRKITPSLRPRVLIIRHLQMTGVESHSDGCTKKSTGSVYPLHTSTVNLTLEGAPRRPLPLVVLRRNTSIHRQTEPLLLASAGRALTRLNLRSREEAVSWP